MADDTATSEQKIKVTDDEADAFKAMMACRLACDEVVRSIVREWESVQMSESELWKRIALKYKLDLRTTTYHFDKYEQCVVGLPMEHDLTHRFRKAKRYVDDILKMHEDGKINLDTQLK